MDEKRNAFRVDSRENCSVLVSPCGKDSSPYYGVPKHEIKEKRDNRHYEKENGNCVEDFFFADKSKSFRNI